MSRLEETKSLVILCPSWVGDVVMASCVWIAARAAYPAARITLAIRPHLAELLEGVSEVDAILPVNTKQGIASVHALKQMNADTIILLPNSFRSALIARLSGIPNRIGYARGFRSALMTRAIEPRKSTEPIPTADYYNELATNAFGASDTSSTPSIGLSKSQQETASQIIESIEHPIVLLVPGASKAKKRWCPSRFAQVADALTNAGATCCVVGSPDEQHLAQAVAKHASLPVIDLTTKGLSLGSLKGVVKESHLMITNDTGPRHLAVATGTPVITLYGPTDFRWTSYASENDVALLAEPFLPRNLIADNHEQACDIDKIPTGDVIEVALRMLPTSD